MGRVLAWRPPKLFDRQEFILFLILLASYTYFFPRWADWNQNSRLDLVLAIVAQHSVTIDTYYQNTGDYAYFEGWIPET